LIEESRRGRDQEHAPLPFCERGRSAKEAERDAFALFVERSLGRIPVFASIGN